METANPYQMFKLPDFDPITFLVARKFPGAPTIAPRHYDEARRRLWEAAQKFRGELEAMPSETFDALLKAEQGLVRRTPLLILQSMPSGTECFMPVPICLW
jgi:hypothetical protein